MDEDAGVPDDGVIESPAELLRAVPISMFSISGQLRFDGERLTFRGGLGDRLRLDAPVAELHSVAPMASMGLHVWHGEDRYRFTIGALSPSTVNTGSDVGDAVNAAGRLPAAARADRRNRGTTANLVSRLQAGAGEPPPGLRVRPPWPGWSWWVGIIVATLVLVAVITGIVFLTG